MGSNVKPQAREAGLVIEELDDELLVYDLERHRAHCLNNTAALVWRQCDGKTGVDAIASRLRRESHMPIDDEVVMVALRKLGKANLLRERVTLTKALEFGSSRRDLLKKLALVGGLSVVTIISPTAAQAATGCTTKVSCKHTCLNNKLLPASCPDPADRQNGHCCGSQTCVQTAAEQSGNLGGTCSGAPCCTA